MYEIRPESLQTFVTDTGVKLPRFQRKQTWDDIKKFKLIISLFKGYPLGVCILNEEKTNEGTVRWLLDGRQRRSALLNAYLDPESLYNWARKFLKLRNSDQPDIVKDKFWLKISEYLEDEDDQQNENQNDITISKENLTDLESLLKIILLIHPKKVRYSGFTKPFDFSKIIERLPYITYINGKHHLVSRKVRSFINGYRTFCRDENLEICRDSFSSYVSQRFSLNSEKERKFEKLLERSWEDIQERIKLIEQIENIYISSKIGYIVVKNLSSVDAQKIFNIINSEGTQLTAVEILSARPIWNEKIENPSEELKERAKKFYLNAIDTIPEDIVKWDVAATLVDRINIENQQLFLKSFNLDDKKDFETKITLGFKILSGIFIGGIKKEDIDKLGKDRNINWEIDVEQAIDDINSLLQIISNSTYFKYLKSWQFSLLNSLSVAVTLNFILLMYKDWQRKGKPRKNSSKNMKAFQKNAFILLDRLIYEYLTRQWRGSSDSKIGKNLKSFGSEGHFTAPDIFEPLPTNKWIDLLEEIFESNSIQNEKISNHKILVPILYHFYALKRLMGPGANYIITVDHIIPQDLFDKSTLPDKKYLKHNLFNLAFLPQSDNSSKGNKRLDEITDSWLKDQIEKYTFIKKEDFPKYSKLNNWKELKDFRKEIFLEVFQKEREDLLLG